MHYHHPNISVGGCPAASKRVSHRPECSGLGVRVRPVCLGGIWDIFCKESDLCMEVSTVSVVPLPTDPAHRLSLDPRIAAMADLEGPYGRGVEDYRAVAP